MKPYLFHGEDDSVLIEWIGANVRFGLSLEADISKSSWYYVDPSNGIAECGELPSNILSKITAAIRAGYDEEAQE